MKLSNHNVQKDIVAAVSDFFSEASIVIVSFGPLEINCFSICFWIDLDGPKGTHSVYIKIPKIIFYDKSKTDLNDISKEDRRLAINEYDSLNYLADYWDDSFGVKFVKSLGYIKKYNAIITKRIKADFFFNLYRAYDNYGRPGDLTVDPVKNGLKNFATSLSAFHSQSSSIAKFYADDSVPKFGKYFDILAKHDVDPKSLNTIKKYLSEYQGYSCDGYKVNNFKGIDIRQIFIDHNELSIIDPGKISIGFAEADVARFIVTCRILYWGTAAIILRIRPSVVYEKSFLDGYYGARPRPKKMLTFLIIKEVLKHWNMAHISLSNRSWNKFAKYILKKVYVDSFYYKLITDELSGLEGIMGYELHTKTAYRNKEKAKDYQDQYIKGAKWARFTMWRQKYIIQKFVDYCMMGKDDAVLDIPCGTGYIGDILGCSKAGVVASDISMEMMNLADGEYNRTNLAGFVQSDITKIPFPDEAFKSVIVLALMHRLPKEMRKKVLSEIRRVSSNFVIISYSVESVAQRIKQWLLLKTKRSHVPAPYSIPLQVIRDELASSGFKIIKMKHIVYFLSAKVVFLIEK